MKEKNIYSCEYKIYAIFLHDSSESRTADAPVQVPNHGPFRALLDGGGNFLDGDLLSGGRHSPGDLLPSTVPKLRNLLTHWQFMCQLTPRGKFQLPMFQI